MNTREGGFGMVELAASLTLLILGLLSMAVGFHGASQLAESTRDNYLLNLAHRNVVGELQGSLFENLTNEYGPGSGKESFWIGTSDPTNQAVGDVAYSAPTSGYANMATGNIQFFTNESSPPSTWTGVTGGLDLDFDGSVSGTCSDYRILPVRIDVIMAGADGPRTSTVDFILTKPRS